MVGAKEENKVGGRAWQVAPEKVTFEQRGGHLQGSVFQVEGGTSARAVRWERARCV